MAVTLANNALFADLVLVKMQLKIKSTEIDHDDYLKNLVNNVSATCESMLKVKDGFTVYKGLIKKQEITGEVIPSQSGSVIETIFYPVHSITKIEYTANWVSYSDYLTPYQKLDDFRVSMPNDVIREVPGASRMNYYAGFETIPNDIIQVALEMIQRKYDESGYSGNKQLALTSMGASSEGSTSINFAKIEERWSDVMNQYKKVIAGRSIGISL